MNIAQRLIASLTLAGLAYTSLRPWFWGKKEFSARPYYHEFYEMQWGPTLLQAAAIVFCGASFYLLSAWTNEILGSVTGKPFLEKHPGALALFSVVWVAAGSFLIRALWLKCLALP